MDSGSDAVSSTKTGPVTSGLTGSEMYCAALLGLTPGNLIIGNSVFSMGVFGGISSRIKSTWGGELNSFTEMVGQGRKQSFERLKQEQLECGAVGVTGVSSDLVFHENNVEFLSIGSGLRMEGETSPRFTTSADAQELFCLVDAGYQPLSFAFGNVSYSIGIASNAMGNIRQLARGEVKEYSEIFSYTRGLALQRICQDAKAVGANSVIGIKTTILPFAEHEIQEMVMIGTAANHPMATNLPPQTGIITSDLSAQETWNISKLGYMPMELVLGTSVYSIGVIGGIKNALQELVHGEVDNLTKIIYGAREGSIDKLRTQAQDIGADDVLGIKTYIYDLGSGLVEFLAIGTAVKKVEGLKTRSEQLPPQAIMRKKETFVDVADMHTRINLNMGNTQTDYSSDI